MGVLEISNVCPVDIFIFPGDMSLVSRRYYVGLLKIFDRCPRDIW